jgi:hypothetical protein
LLVILVSALAAALRLPTRSRLPVAWDPVNFSLAVDRLDLPSHQPHPPAAIGYVLVGRLLAPPVGDVHLALVLVNVAFTALAGLLVFALAFHASHTQRARRGWLALVALLASPLFWYYGCVAEIYAAETALGLLVAYACYRTLHGRPDHATLAGLALAVLGAFRVTGAVFLLPVFIATLVWAHARARRSAALGALAFVAGTAAWAVPLLLWAGPATYFRVLFSHFVTTAEPTSILAGGSLRILNRHVRDAMEALLAGVGLFNAVALPVYLVLRRPRLLPAPGLAGFAALWVLPGLSFYVLVHMAKPGYVLPAVPAACLVLAFLYGQEPRRLLRAVLVAGQILAGGWQFLLAQPGSGTAIGEGTRYARKTWVQKARIELNSVLQTGRRAITRSDRELTAIGRELRSACPGARGVVLVGRDGAGPNWRQLMYLFPEAVSVRLPASRGTPWMTATGRRLTVATGADLSVGEVCQTLWVDPPPAVLDALRAHATPRPAPAQEVPLYWTRGPLRLSLGSGHQLVIGRRGSNTEIVPAAGEGQWLHKPRASASSTLRSSRREASR